MPATLHAMMFDRLRADPIPSTVGGSLPVLFFGDLYAARIATIGINPSRQEYLSSAGLELDGEMRRFETLRSLGAGSRQALRDEQAAQAVERMRGYFDNDKPIYSWFNSLTRVVNGMGFSFAERTAAHLDLVQEATDPVWSGLSAIDKGQAAAVLNRDLPFLKWQIESFPLRAIVSTSARVMREVANIVEARPVAEGALARLRWSVGIADTLHGPLGVAGWNIPLARPTGLKKEDERELGAILAAGLCQSGCIP